MSTSSVERERDGVLAFHVWRMLASGRAFDNARRYLRPSGSCNDTSGDLLTGLHMVLYPVYRNRTAAARREMRAQINSSTCTRLAVREATFATSTFSTRSCAARASTGAPGCRRRTRSRCTARDLAMGSTSATPRTKT